MSQTPNIGSLVGVWTYRSFLNDPDLTTPYDQYLFGSGYITIAEAPMGVFKGVIGDTGWSLDLNGSINYGNPYAVRFQGVGIVGGDKWAYSYSGYVIPPWPNSVNQVPSMVGSIVPAFPPQGPAPSPPAPPAL